MSRIPSGPSILLLHDGELEDVRALLAQLGTEPVTRRRQDPVPEAPRSWKLIVATSRRALADPACIVAGGDGTPPCRVVVTTEDSPTLRKQLRACGFDFLVRRPVDPEALRLLFLRLLYQGPERRGNERFPSGREVTYHLEGREQFALLGDLSESGCRLLHAARADAGQALVVDVPADEGGHGTVSVRGHVLRVVEPQPGERGSALAIGFDAFDERSRERIREALRTSVVGSAVAPRKTGVRSERRSATRGAFRRRVVAFQDEADRVLMGRDLSAGGMRLEPHPALHVGDRLRLAIYADAASQPWTVRGTVVRNDEGGGLGLRFDEVPPDVERRIEAFVASLPCLEPLQRGELGSLGAVLTRILD